MARMMYPAAKWGRCATAGQRRLAAPAAVGSKNEQRREKDYKN